MQTPIRWAGSKKALLPVLRKYWNTDYKRYVEPFCGSACLFFDIEPRRALLSDINRELIGAYKIIKSQPEKVIRRLRRITPTKVNYYKLRAQNPDELSEVELGARFLFLNKQSFNGIYRTNLSGRFNVPYAEPKHPIAFDYDAIRTLSHVLRNTTLLAIDFENALARTKAGDFVYLDPPYAIANRRMFREYQPESFSTVDLSRLSLALRDLDEKGVNFVISYADSSEGRALASEWNWRRVRTRRNVAGFASDRKTAYEVLASNLELAQ